MASVAVVGIGSVGAAVAACLETDDRHRVTLCGRKDLDGAVAVESADGVRHALRSPYLTSPDALGDRVEWVILAVKAHQVNGAAGWLKALCHPSATVVVLQNGIEHSAQVEGIANGATILPGIVWSPSERVTPTLVRVRQRLTITVPPGVSGQEFVSLMEGTSAAVSVAADFHSDAWQKLCINAVAGLMAVTGSRAGIFSSAAMGDLARRLAAECAEVGRADGARIPDEFPDRIVSELRAMPVDMGTSILFDRLAGHPLEWEARNGVIQRLGRSYAIATPISDVLVPMLEGISSNGISTAGDPRSGPVRPIM